MLRYCSITEMMNLFKFFKKKEEIIEIPKIVNPIQKGKNKMVDCINCKSDMCMATRERLENGYAVKQHCIYCGAYVKDDK